MGNRRIFRRNERRGETKVVNLFFEFRNLPTQRRQLRRDTPPSLEQEVSLIRCLRARLSLSLTTRLTFSIVLACNSLRLRLGPLLPSDVQQRPQPSVDIHNPVRLRLCRKRDSE